MSANGKPFIRGGFMYDAATAAALCKIEDEARREDSLRRDHTAAYWELQMRRMQEHNRELSDTNHRLLRHIEELKAALGVRRGLGGTQQEGRVSADEFVDSVFLA